MVNFEWGIFYPMKEHIHARKVVCSNVIFLTINFAYAFCSHAVSHVEQQRTRAAGKIQYAGMVPLLTSFGLLAVQCDNSGEDV